MDIPEKIQKLTSDKNFKEDKTTEDNNEISKNYGKTRKMWNQTNVVLDNIFSYNVALNIISENEDFETKSVVEECRQRKNWFLIERSNWDIIKFTFQMLDFWTNSPNTWRCQTCGI